MAELLYENLSYQIRGVAYTVKKNMDVATKKFYIKGHLLKNLTIKGYFMKKKGE